MLDANKLLNSKDLYRLTYSIGVISNEDEKLITNSIKNYKEFTRVICNLLRDKGYDCRFLVMDLSTEKIDKEMTNFITYWFYLISEIDVNFIIEILYKWNKRASTCVMFGLTKYILVNHNNIGQAYLESIIIRVISYYSEINRSSYVAFCLVRMLAYSDLPSNVNLLKELSVLYKDEFSISYYSFNSILEIYRRNSMKEVKL